MGFHGFRCNQLDDCRLPYGRQMDLWPRGHLKTHIITMGKSIQEYLCDNNVRILLAASSKDGAVKNLRKIKQIFETNTLLHWLFPECIPDTKNGKWAETEVLLPRTANHPETTFKCIGVGGHIVGWHFDVIRKDDLIDDKTEKSPEVMEKIIDWHILTKSLFESPSAGVDHIIGTRWAMFDLYQYVMDREKEYKVNVISALYTDEKTKHVLAAWPERFTKEALYDLREKDPYIFACSRGDQPILMADWHEKPIQKVNVGDKIIGWTKSDGRQRLCESTVLNTGHQGAELAKITTVSGRVTYQTFDHQWWQQKRQFQGTSPYSTVLPGDCLTSCYKPSAQLDPAHSELAAWLGGMFDADGTISAKGTKFTIYQSIIKNPALCEKICDALDVLGINCEVSLDPRRHVALISVCGRSNMLKFARLCRPYKLTNWLPVADRLSEDNGQDQIVSMEPVGDDEVFWLTTTTGNYVVSGYLSKNCQQMNNPRDEAVTDFRSDWLRYYGFSDDALNILCEVG